MGQVRVEVMVGERVVTPETRRSNWFSVNMSRQAAGRTCDERCGIGWKRMYKRMWDRS